MLKQHDRGAHPKSRRRLDSKLAAETASGILHLSSALTRVQTIDLRDHERTTRQHVEKVLAQELAEHHGKRCVSRSENQRGIRLLAHHALSHLRMARIAGIETGSVDDHKVIPPHRRRHGKPDALNLSSVPFVCCHAMH